MRERRERERERDEDVRNAPPSPHYVMSQGKSSSSLPTGRKTITSGDEEEEESKQPSNREKKLSTVT